MQEPSPGVPNASLPLFPGGELTNNSTNNNSSNSDNCDADSDQDNVDPQVQARFEADKRAVYKHPLFPLLALMFEKCEIATQFAEVHSAESFNLDIQAFVQHQERDGKPFFSDDPDVDGLMVKAIQVFRIHLLELEKVQELCKDFCNRYITCLKNKMQSENLLRSDYPGLPSCTGNSSSSEASSSPHSMYSNGSQQDMTSFVRIQPRVSQAAVPIATAAVSPASQTSTVYQMVQTPQGIVAQPIQIQTSPLQPNVTTHVIHGSTPLSQIGVSMAPVQVAQQSDTTRNVPSIAPRSCPGSGEDDDTDPLSKRKQKRGVLPKQATSIMRSWLFQHLVHPYPTEDEKRQLAAQTNLTLLQVNNWFINARRRILQPMLDSSSSESNKSKKSKNQSSRCVQRFWPESIASIQPQVPSQDNECHQTSGSNPDEDPFDSSDAAPLSPSGSLSLSDASSAAEESFNGPSK